MATVAGMADWWCRSVAGGAGPPGGRARARSLPCLDMGSRPPAIALALPRTTRRTSKLLVGLGLRDLLAAIEAVRANVVAQMGFARHRFDGERRIGKRAVRAVHPAFRRRFLVLLDSHVFLLEWWVRCAPVGA